MKIERGAKAELKRADIHSVDVSAIPTSVMLTRHAFKVDRRSARCMNRMDGISHHLDGLRAIVRYRETLDKDSAGDWVELELRQDLPLAPTQKQEATNDSKKLIYRGQASQQRTQRKGPSRQGLADAERDSGSRAAGLQLAIQKIERRMLVSLYNE